MLRVAFRGFAGSAVFYRLGRLQKARLDDLHRRAAVLAVERIGRVEVAVGPVENGSLA